MTSKGFTGYNFGAKSASRQKDILVEGVVQVEVCSVSEGALI